MAEIAPVAEAHGATLAQMVIAWTLRQPGITFALCGARNPEQARENAGAGRIRLSTDDIDTIERGSHAPSDGISTPERRPDKRADRTPPSAGGDEQAHARTPEHESFAELRRDGAFDVSSSAAASTASACSASWRCRAACAAGRARRLLLRLQRGAVAHDPWRPALSGERRVRPRARIAARARRAAAQRAASGAPAADDGADPSVFSGLLNGAGGFLGVPSRPAERGALPVKIGLSSTTGSAATAALLPRHRFRGARETVRLWPELPPAVRFAATYYDAWISYPERLGIELHPRYTPLGAGQPWRSTTARDRGRRRRLRRDSTADRRTLSGDGASDRQRHRRLGRRVARRAAGRRRRPGAAGRRHQGLAPDPRQSASCATRSTAT